MIRIGKTQKTIAVIALLLVYTLIAAAPVPKETVLAISWAASLETSAAEPPGSAPDGPLVPFELGGRFGYVSLDGRFSVN